MNLGVPAVDAKGTRVITIAESPLEELALEFVNTAKGNKVTCRKGDTQLWTDSIPSPIVHVNGSSKFLVVSTIDGRLIVYSLAGRR